MSKQFTAEQIALLRVVIDRLRKYPETYDQGMYYIHDPGVGQGVYPEGLCGTKCCLAGHLVLAAGMPKPPYKLDSLSLAIWFHVTATRLLGLDTLHSDRLFGWQWPQRYERAWLRASHAGDMQGKAYAAISLLEDLIEKGPMVLNEE
jgi:hypothetical protein